MDDRCNQVIWEKHIKIDKASLLGRKSKYLDSEITIYTDGSKIGGKVGSGFVVFKRKKVIFFQNARLPDKATVFQAEDGIRDAQESRGLGDVYKRQI